MIQIDNLQKIVGQRTALNIERLNVASGEIAAVVGPADSGIETLFEILIGKARPSAGTVRLSGIDPTQKSAYSRNVGILFAEDALYKRQSPLANLSLQCQLYGLPKRRAQEVLAQIGMADQANANLDRLPTSLLRRLAFGRAILHNPHVLLLYEPFARCDEATIALLSGLMRKFVGQGTAILILAGGSIHLAPLCDKIYTLQLGRLVETDLPGEEDRSSLQFKIPVKLEDKVMLINPAEILYIEAEEGRTCLRTFEARIATQFTLGELEARLSRSGFFRAHRSYLVNLQHVKEVIPFTRNSFTLRLDDADNTEIPLSKAAAGELRDLLGY
ncbi:MAG: LytTR family transcriptional regulator DNA-binding domain-containing protein [Anaerolineales bacterium]